MRRPAAVASVFLALALCLPGAAAAPTLPEECRVPEHFVQVDGMLPRVALMAADKRLDILVIGTGSSVLPGPEGAANSYPARLRAALAERLPGVEVVVRTDVRPRRATADMASALQALAPEQQPGLVVWQTGTVEAIRQMDPGEFRERLEEAVLRLKKLGIDVLLVNMQYSPRTDVMITEGPYAEAMQWVAQQAEVPLFDRLGVMRYWSQEGVFDLSASNRLRVAERVHDCIGRLLAELIIHSAALHLPKVRAGH